MDFAEHRGYVPGDDIRRVDWRLFARTDRYYVKQYEADTNTNFSRAARRVEVDGLHEPHGVSKLDYAQLPRRVPRLPGAPAARPRRHHHLRQRHRRRTCRPRPSTSTSLLHTLDRAKAERPGQPARGRCTRWPSTSGAAASSCSSRTSTRTRTRSSTPSSRCGSSATNCMVFHVLDPAEIDFDFDDASSFEDLESGEQMPGRARVVRATSTGKLIAAHVEALSTKFSEHRIDYTLLNTAKPLDQRALQLPRRPRRAAGAACRIVADGPSSPRCSSLGLGGARHPGPDPPDPARDASASCTFPSLMFLAADSVSVGPAAADPPLVPAADARWRPSR